MLQSIDLVSLTGILVVACGYLLSLLIFLSYVRSKQKQSSVLVLGITIFAASSSWLGSAAGYAWYLSTGTVLADDIYLLLFAWGIALALPGIVFIVANLLGQSPRNMMVWLSISGALASVYLAEVYILFPLGIVRLADLATISHIPPLDLGESSFVGFPLIFAGILIIVGILLGAILIFHGYGNSSVPSLRFRGIMMGSGLVLFALAGVVDAQLENISENVLILVLARIVICIGLVLLAIGVVTPNIVKRRLRLEVSSE